MLPFYADDRATVHHGDCLDVLRTLPDASVDAVVTDPPYELGFMGKGWDASGIAYRVDLWAECLRVLKPGGHLLAFGGTRTWHRLTCAIEDAGFDIRDTITWLYGSGFPKSLDVSKAIDRIRDWTLVERLSGEIKRARAEAGLSLAQIGQAMQDATDGQYGTWYRRGGHMFFETGRSLPSRPEWERLREVLPIRPEFADVYAQAEREVVGMSAHRSGIANGTAGHYTVGGTRAEAYTLTAPATEDAARWQGWGTALKPASEPVVVARKPLAGTVASNVLTHGTGALNIDATRVGGGEARRVNTNPGMTGGRFSAGEYESGSHASGTTQAGRWPANVVLTHGDCGDECVPGCPVAELDAQSGNRPTGDRAAGTYRNGRRGGIMGEHVTTTTDRSFIGDDGGASRFFPTFRYQAKAPTRERPKVDGVAHPTVKPLALMAWLVRLVTPPGGVVLDPFAGSGTTVEAALAEGFRCITIEREAEYLPLILARIERQAAPASSDGPEQMSLLDEPAA
jgi:DNA modification methylase